MAQKLDNNFISVYARDSPTSEDVAESLGPFLYLHRNSFTDDTARKIRESMGFRIQILKEYVLFD